MYSLHRPNGRKAHFPRECETDSSRTVSNTSLQSVCDSVPCLMCCRAIMTSYKLLFSICWSVGGGLVGLLRHVRRLCCCDCSVASAWERLSVFLSCRDVSQISLQRAARKLGGRYVPLCAFVCVCVCMCVCVCVCTHVHMSMSMQVSVCP